MLKALGESTPGYKIRDMVKEVDIDENGTVEFDEFVKVCKCVDIQHPAMCTYVQPYSVYPCKTMYECMYLVLEIPF